ncbi:MAG: hypothetical protein U0872_15340 [Planctomycetaceae bacterium]
MSDKCPKCETCFGSSHHWLPNPDFGNDAPDAHDAMFTHVCKHCDTVGMECVMCDGSGFDPDDLEGICRECDGEGVEGILI